MLDMITYFQNASTKDYKRKRKKELEKEEEKRKKAGDRVVSKIPAQTKKRCGPVQGTGRPIKRCKKENMDTSHT